MKETFKKIITDFYERKLPPTIPRDLRIPFDSGKVVSLIGVGRSGKTSMCTILSTSSGQGSIR